LETLRGTCHRAFAVSLGWVILTVGGCHSGAGAPVARSLPVVGSRAELDHVTIADESRFALHGKQHRLPLRIPAAARLDVGFGVVPQAYSKRAWPGDLAFVDFSVTYQHGASSGLLAQQRITLPAQGLGQWHDVTVNLDGLAGTDGMLVLEATPSSPAAPDSDFVWTNPRLNTGGASTATNVILISIDTLRADHLGVYGYAPPTSPNIDRMAAAGTVFRNFVASSSWTLPSHASMLTGLDPQRHGAVQFLLFGPLPAELDMLAELLWDRGYETGGFVGGGYVGNYWNFGQGFDRYKENMVSQWADSDTLQWSVDQAKTWMEERHGRPFFLFLHTYQVHMPYTPPPPFDTAFDPEYRGPNARGLTMTDLRTLQRTSDVDARFLRHMEALYDGEIRAMDATLGDLIEFLRTSGLARNTCVIFTSDHGEEFREHGGLFHRQAKLYEELVHVPLIVWCPARFAAGRSIDGLASHTDIAPTILELTGAPVPDGLDGRSLLAALEGKEQRGREVAISEVDGSIVQKTGTVKAIRTDRYKLVESSIDGSEKLFDLRADPDERRDLRSEEPAVARQVQALAGARDGKPPVAAAQVATPDAGVRERLRALGYGD
jgi:arylsulfatase A-like enzyme